MSKCHLSVTWQYKERAWPPKLQELCFICAAEVLELAEAGGQRQPGQSLQRGDARRQTLHHWQELLNEAINLLQGPAEDHVTMATPWLEKSQMHTKKKKKVCTTTLFFILLSLQVKTWLTEIIGLRVTNQLAQIYSAQ